MNTVGCFTFELRLATYQIINCSGAQSIILIILKGLNFCFEVGFHEFHMTLHYDRWIDLNDSD
jgi:hypothetical protein